MIFCYVSGKRTVIRYKFWKGSGRHFKARLSEENRALVCLISLSVSFNFSDTKLMTVYYTGKTATYLSSLEATNYRKLREYRWNVVLR